MTRARGSDSTSYVEIEWQAPSECPDSRSVKAHTERLLGQPLHAAPNQRVVARASVRRNEAGNWQLSLSLASNEQVAEETLVAKQCRALADATALKVALAIDPLATARAIEASAQRVQVGPPALEGRAVSTEQKDTEEGEYAEEAPQPASVVQGGVRLDLGAGLDLLPGLALGGNVGVWLQRFGWRGELSGRAFVGEASAYPKMPAVGARLQLFGGVLRGCHLWSAGSIELPLCLGVDAGVSRGIGFGLATVNSATSWWAAVELGPALRLPLSERVAIWIEADANLPFLRSGFNVRNLGSVYTTPPVAAMGWVGCEIRLSR